MKVVREIPTLPEANRRSFWSRVDRGDASACWEWRGVRVKGYGHFKYHRVRYQAHRVAYALANGSAPMDMMVCHRCDNAACCNPSHLFLGTAQDNARDMVRKGRNGKGAPRKLTVDQVRQIRALRPSTTLRKLAEMFGVTDMAIHRIHKGVIWKSVEAFSPAAPVPH